MKKNTTLLGLFAVSSLCNAGAYVELDIGVHLTNWKGASQFNIETQDGLFNIYHRNGRNLGGENPLGSIRIGYEYKNMHAYYQHLSSLTNNQDTGIDILMAGVRYEIK